MSPPVHNQQMQWAFKNIAACAGGHRGDKLKLVATRAECAVAVLTCPETGVWLGALQPCSVGLLVFPSAFLSNSAAEAARLC